MAHDVKNKRFSKPKFIAVDFFCGAGGTTSGLISAGGYVLAGVDNAKSCKTTYEKNNRNRIHPKKAARFLNYDIFVRRKDYPQGQQHLLLSELERMIREAKEQFPGVPLLFSICAPCQPFSRLSKQKVSAARFRKHVRDRSLLLQCLSIVRTFKPDMIFSENVAAITSSKYGEVWAKFQDGLRRHGYHTGADVVDAVDFGVAQYRKRSILLAARRHLASESSDLTVPNRKATVRVRTVKETIGHLPRLRPGQRHRSIPNHATRALSDLNFKRLASAVPGESNAKLKDTQYGDLSLKCHRKVKRKFGTICFGDVYTRMHPDRPAPTITTRCLSVSNGRFGHYSQVRPISIREAALLQSFPANYIFYPMEELEAPARMIGNAVPPKLARFFAEHLLSVINQ